MTNTLREGEFDLDGLAFGGEDHNIVVLPRGFRPGGWTTSHQDAQSSVGDYIAMGRDTLAPATWSFDVATNAHDATGAQDALNEFATRWSARAARSGRGAVSVLRYRIGGRTRWIYGRARRFTPVVTQAMWDGIAAAVIEFQPVETVTYDDEPRSIVISSRVSAVGGLIAPFVAPFTTVRRGSRDGSIADVGGTVETPPIITIHGPITRPFVEGPDWRIELDTHIADGTSVVIDAHPAIGTVRRQDGASLSGALTLQSRLSRVRLHPGTSYVTFGGTDPTGTSTCEVRWHPAHPSF